ncbi:probable WRKY transcription factor 62 [Phragmites australis]|uniref:probable WRKY transcription factor 62 n=1 Tax=Phragmites australis TaxID=29695 RepID=UPI002D7A076E|nr:probable WRKY transcription factor 62 [Phragmites australis]
MSPSPSPSPSDRMDVAIQELRRGTQLAALLRQQVELIPEHDHRDVAVANVSEISMAIESSLCILQSESEHCSSSVAMASPAAYSDGASRTRNGAVARTRKARHRRGRHGEEHPIKEILTEAPENDRFHWRKYGEKKILDAEYPRLYYKCGYSNDCKCPAKKYVQQQNNSSPPMFMVALINKHTCGTLFPNEPSSSSGAAQVLDFSKASLSPPLMAGARGLKKDEEASTSMTMPATFAYHESSPSLQSLSPNGDQVGFPPGFEW